MGGSGVLHPIGQHGAGAAKSSWIPPEKGGEPPDSEEASPPPRPLKADGGKTGCGSPSAGMEQGMGKNSRSRGGRGRVPQLGWGCSQAMARMERGKERKGGRQPGKEGRRWEKLQPGPPPPFAEIGGAVLWRADGV